MKIIWSAAIFVFLSATFFFDVSQATEVFDFQGRAIACSQAVSSGGLKIYVFAVDKEEWRAKNLLNAVLSELSIKEVLGGDGEKELDFFIIAISGGNLLAESELYFIGIDEIKRKDYSSLVRGISFRDVWRGSELK